LERLGTTPELRVDGVIVESRAGAALLAALPTFRDRGIPVFCIPHGTALALASLPARTAELVARPVRLLAVHTAHWDPVYERVERFLTERHPEVRFAHWSPNRIFSGPEGDLAGRMIRPAQLRRVQAQLAEIDLTIVKQSGCLSEPEFCRRFKPGQRLLHAWAAGVPTVIVLGASSTMQGYLEDAMEDGSPIDSAYPEEAVVAHDGCEASVWSEAEDGTQSAKVFCDGPSDALMAALDRAINDAELRGRMRAAGLRLAARWGPRRVAEGYAEAFAEVLGSTADAGRGGART